MAVKNINEISITGFSHLILYAFSYQPGFADSYGTVEAQFISENGVFPSVNVMDHSYFPIYFKNDAGTQQLLGNFTVITSTESADGKLKTLSVKFADRSVELDRYIVALRGETGYDSLEYNSLSAKEKTRIIGAISPGGRVLWVGESDENCKEEISGGDGTDLCDPCPEKLTHAMYRQLDCEQYYLNNRRIYKYNSTDLATAAAATGLAFVGFPSSGLYKFQYSGTLRQVLNNICSELGYSFCYNPSTNQLNFLRTSAGISINIKNLESPENKCKILSKQVTKSRESSKSVWGVAGFSRDSEEKRYTCGLNTCRKIQLMPFTLTDILPNAAHFSGSANGFSRLEFYSMLNHRLGKGIRDLMVWAQEYQIRTDVTTEAKIGQKLNYLNGMTIKKVFSVNSADEQSKYVYRLMLRILSAKDFDAMRNISATKKSFFFVAETNEKYEEKINNLETSIAGNFLGQYWIRRFKEHWNSLSYQTVSPDGSINYYDFKAPINLPFSDIVFEAYETLNGSPLLDLASGSTPDGLEAKDTFFLMSRPAAAWPVNYSDALLGQIESQVSKYLFKEISVPSGISNYIKDIVPTYDPTTHKLFIVESPLEDVTVSLAIGNSDHPGEEENLNLPTVVCNKRTSYGLRSSNTKRFSVTLGSVSFEIYLPAQSSVDGNKSGYNAILEKTGEDGTYVIPKIEAFASSPVPTYSSPSLTGELNLYNATENDLSLLSVESGIGYCDMDPGKIQNLLNPLRSLNTYTIGQTEERQYTIEGFPKDFYYPIDGLKSINVSLGSEGLKTTLSFSNSFPFKLTSEQYIKTLNNLRLRNLEKTPSGSYNHVISTDLPEVDY